jgi:hypothetical protein
MKHRDNFTFTCSVYCNCHLTAWNRAVVENPPVAQLLKNFRTLHGIGSFVVVFTRARHWPLSWARWISSIPHPISVRFVLILSYLRLGLLFARLSHLKTLYACLLHALLTSLLTLLFSLAMGTSCERRSQWPRVLSHELFARSNTGLVGSNPTQVMDACVRSFCV